jgi:hypothetical protein
MSGKTVRARDLRDPRALPRELRRIAEKMPVNEHQDIIQHAADELEEAQRAADPGRPVPHHGSGPPSLPTKTVLHR